MVSIKFLILIQTGDIQGCLPCKHAFHTECLIPWLEVRTVVEITTLMILHFHNLAYLFPLKMPILNNFVRFSWKSFNGWLSLPRPDFSWPAPVKDWLSLQRHHKWLNVPGQSPSKVWLSLTRICQGLIVLDFDESPTRTDLSFRAVLAKPDQSLSSVLDY